MIVSTNSYIVDIFKQHIEFHKLSKARLAEFCNYTPQSFSKVLNRNRDLPVGLYVKLCKELGYNPQELLMEAIKAENYEV